MWDDLRRRAEAARDRRIADLLDADRAADFSVEACGMHLDYSKTTLAASDRDLLVALCRDAGLEARRDAMFAGRRINETEGRAVLHTALRNLDGGPVEVDGQDVMPQVQATLERMETFARAVRDGAFRGQGGPVTDIVNIGIGGSDLGPAMAVQALAAYHDGPRCHFVSNVDAAHVADTLRRLDPATTLVIVASKTFTTIETMTNAATAKAWMSEAVADPGAQFAALSTAADRTAAFGIDAARVFGFADWVGGRYSVWGPIGLALMIAIGPEAFRAFLRGAEAMDRHFRAAEPLENMPVMLALVGLWHNQGCGYATRAVLPYEQRLGRLPAYLQQLEMESNGKRVAMDGTTLAVESGPVVWGEPGTNGQHAFYQLIHQGTRIVPCEFMVGAEGHEPDLAHQHRLLIANCLAQAEALMTGRTFSAAKALLGDRFDGDELDRQARHRVFPGNRPSTMLLYPKLTPEVLGQIVALYEHRVFVEGVCLGINSFDQWGVELGKELAEALAPVVAGDESAEGKDASTAALVGWLGAAPGMSAPSVPQQMAVLTLAVADLDRARAFYDAGFGWRPAFENDTIAFYQMNGFVLGLFLEAAFAEDAARAVGSGGRVAMAHNVPGRDDVAPLMDRLLASGGTLLRAADAPPHGGFRGYVADPDGHAWEIAWNPDWPIDAEGRVTFAL